MSGDDNPRRGSHEPRSGRPDYHDPTAGIGGAPPARSALTLRLLLAGFGLIVCIVFAVWLAAINGPVVLVVALALLAAVALVDIVVVIRRKARGEPS